MRIVESVLLEEVIVDGLWNGNVLWDSFVLDMLVGVLIGFCEFVERIVMWVNLIFSGLRIRNGGDEFV